MTPSDYELIEQGYDPPRVTLEDEINHLKYERQEIIDNALKEQASLEDENRRLREALKAMEASRDQWANIAVQRGLELEARAALAAEPASGDKP